MCVAGGESTIDGGSINNNEAPRGGGVVVEDGKLTLKLGTISENKASNNGGGVCVLKGEFKMEGGTISGNSAVDNGGGVSLQDMYYAEGPSIFTMTGGEITDNTGETYGGGVFLENNKEKMTVGGTAKITDNKVGTSDNNVYLRNDMTIAIASGSDAPTSEMSIGITTPEVPAVESPVSITGTGVSESYRKNFFADKSDEAMVAYRDSKLVLLNNKGPFIITYTGSDVGFYGAGGEAKTESSMAGEIVGFKAELDPGITGKKIKSVTAKDFDGNPVDLTSEGGVYSFTTPKADITVTAETESLVPESFNITYTGDDVMFSGADSKPMTLSAKEGDLVVFQVKATSDITNGQIKVTAFETDSKKELNVVTMATDTSVGYRFTMPAASVTVKAEIELTGYTNTIKVSEGIKGIYIQFEGDDEPVYFTAEECLEPATVPAGMKLTFTKVDCEDGYECTMSLPYTYIMPDHDDTFTITAKKKSNPTPVHDSSDNDNTPLFTGTWSNAVTNGSWSQDSNGIWHYTSTEKFKATWGYIINPYAGEGQNKADWFWFDSHGNMLTGWQFINGKWYYLNPTKDGTLGACLIGPARTPDGYEVDASGAWTGR